jgi:hypothetical protein
MFRPVRVDHTNCLQVDVGFVPPILNVTPIHGYFFTGEETGSDHRTGGLTCVKLIIILKRFTQIHRYGGRRIHRFVFDQQMQQTT